MLHVCRTGSRSLLSLGAYSRFLTVSARAMSSPPLQAQKCEPCTAALPAMPQDEAQQMLSTLKGKWSLSPQPKTLLSSKATHPDALHRTYKFKDFTSAQAFANQLGALAESEGHHPAIMVEWGRVTVWWWSHAINGVSERTNPRTSARRACELTIVPVDSFTRMTSSWQRKQKSSSTKPRATPHRSPKPECILECSLATSTSVHEEHPRRDVMC